MQSVITKKSFGFPKVSPPTCQVRLISRYSEVSYNEVSYNEFAPWFVKVFSVKSSNMYVVVDVFLFSNIP